MLQTVVSTCHDVAIAAYRKTQMKHSLGDETETIMETHKSKPGQQYVVPHNCLLFLINGKDTHSLWRHHFSSLFLVFFVSADDYLDIDHDVELAVMFMMRMVLRIM